MNATPTRLWRNTNATQARRLRAFLAAGMPQTRISGAPVGRQAAGDVLSLSVATAR